MLKRSVFVTFLVLCLLHGCTTNPVTGARQWSMPVSQQIAMGKQNYLPSQQQQGGRYLVDPELGLYVNSVGQKIAAYSDLKLPYEFVVLNNDVPNAWALPGGKIAINRGLLVLLDDEAQLAAVLSHEIVHAAAEHGATQMRNSQLLGLGVAAAGVASQNSEYSPYILSGAALGAKLGNARYGRSHELEADTYGINYMQKAGYAVQAAVELQEKFVALSANAGPQDLISGMFASHPPSTQRVQKNAERAAAMPGGVRNKAQFQQAMKQVMRDRSAYSENQKAEQALANSDLAGALSLSQSAIKKQPGEARFHLTMGRIRVAQKNRKAADVAFTKAADLDPEYFLTSLMQGMNAWETGNKTKARAGFERSMNIMPTQHGAYYLGEIEEAAGNAQAAAAWFKQAASAGGDLGQKAEQKLGKYQPQAQ